MRNATASEEPVSGDTTVLFSPYLYVASELTTEFTGHARKVTAQIIHFTNSSR